MVSYGELWCVEIGFYIRKIWDKHDDILLVLIVIALWATNKTPH